MSIKREKNWQKNQSSDTSSHKLAGEVQLKKFGKCMEDYSEKLERIEEILADNMTSTNWDMSFDPMILNASAAEQATLIELLDTDNKVLNKVFIALSALCSEIQHIQREAELKYYNVFLYYGEGKIENSAMSISKLLPILQKLYCFITHCETVLKLSVKQMCSLHDSVSFNAPRLDVHFEVVIEHIGNLLIVLLTLDQVIDHQPFLKDHWSDFKRVISTCSYEKQTNKYKKLNKLITDIEKKVFSGNILLEAIENLLTARDNIKSCTGFLENIVKHIKLYIVNLEAEIEPDLIWIRLSSLFVLHNVLSGNTDKKIFKSLWEPHKKIFGVTLIGNIIWQPEEFFLRNLPHLSQIIDKKVKNQIKTLRINYLQQKVASVQKDAQMYYFQVSAWLIQMDNCMRQDSTNLQVTHLQIRCALFLQGLDYAYSLNRFVKCMLNLHLDLNQTMLKSTVIALCRLIELIKCIHFMYHVHTMAVVESMNQVIQYLTFQALAIAVKAKKSVPVDTKYSSIRLDILSAILLLERSLHGPGTRDRRLIAHLALAVSNQLKTYREDDFVLISNLVKKLDVICEIHYKLKQASDCSFLYWHRNILPIYYSYLFEQQNQFHRLKYIFTALDDCMSDIRSTQLYTNVTKEFNDEMFKNVKEKILEPLCQEIETDLRLHVHSHLQLDDRNPLQTQFNNYSNLLKSSPLRLFGNYINVKNYVENHLNETFYNLTTVALHDWRTYGEMRCLAIQKYNLRTVEDHLPSQTLEQGLDVLEIMRNIHDFVARYLYNLNNQIFVEYSSNNKHLNTLNIRHVANSIRTHGTGIMNTTVNFTYQFLQKKLYILSQFLFDEHIKSRLIKDLKYFRESKNQIDQKYPYERAERFNLNIRKLGLSANKLTYLDQFRILITQIGNAMGYVRMVRSGGLHCCSNAICFIPDLEDIVSFKELSQEKNFAPLFGRTAESLDTVISTFVKNFDESTEYFKLFVDVFAPVCRDKKNYHLQNFHIIVPSLTINFVEYSISCKDKLSKKDKFGASFTDDGFSMGVAYILKMLNLDSEFDSLHWFQSVANKFEKDKGQLIAEQKSNLKDDVKLQQTMNLTAKRLDLYQKEFQLLYYSLSSARIFFQKYSQPSVTKDKVL